jgi:hypothetical protein
MAMFYADLKAAGRSIAKDVYNSIKAVKQLVQVSLIVEQSLEKALLEFEILSCGLK